MLLYYSGRIERARERYAESTQYFRRAAEIAPNDLQSDACIWYMITNAFAGGADAAAALVQSTMPLWKNTSYFSDVLDRLSCHFTRERRWNALMDIFLALENKGRSESLGQYAWILGRAAEEGYLETGRDAESFFRAALAEESSFYYRIMAASKLDARFNPALSSGRAAAGEGEGTRRTQARPDEVDFMLGFFECGAASFALPYIQTAEAELPAPELRKIAEALGASGRWKESIDFVSRYTRRDNYKTSRADFELLYPRPYKSLIEKYAKEFPREAGMGPELLYGLIRTESYFSPDIVSRSGAVGLAQLMAPTARDMANRIARQGGPDYRGNGEVDLTNPEVNVHIGSYYLSYLAGLLENPTMALLAYNGGLGRVRRWLAADRARGALPPDLFLESVEYTETREYGRRVLAAAAIYGWLYR